MPQTNPLHLQREKWTLKSSLGLISGPFHHHHVPGTPVILFISSFLLSLRFFSSRTQSAADWNCVLSTLLWWRVRGMASHKLITRSFIQLHTSHAVPCLPSWHLQGGLTRLEGFLRGSIAKLSLSLWRLEKASSTLQSSSGCTVCQETMVEFVRNRQALCMSLVMELNRVFTRHCSCIVQSRILICEPRRGLMF